ncbi:MAG: hypothetical protein HY011_29820 [Acidobacteria bacterium]|nr:hypothetical protein [Acidobacteriota bacterium]
MKIIEFSLSSLVILALTVSCKIVSLTNSKASDKINGHIQGRAGNKSLVTEFQQIGRVPEGLEPISKVKLSFVEGMHGWLADNRKLWLTQNGGVSWTLIFTSAAKDSLLGCQLVNPDEGWLHTTTGFYKTENAGNNWAKVILPDTDATDSFFDLKFFPDGKHGFISGHTVDKEFLDEPLTNNLSSPDGKHGVKPLFYATENAGKSWRRMGVEDADYDSITEIFILDNSRAWAIAIRGLLSYDLSLWKYVEFDLPTCEQTIDPLTLPYGNLADQLGPTSLSFAGKTHGWIAFKNGQLAKSEDSGKSWCVIPHSVTGWPKFYQATSGQRVHFVDSQSGWWWVEYALYHTKDGGKIWSLVNDSVDAISFVGADQMLILSEGQLFKGNARRH